MAEPTKKWRWLLSEVKKMKQMSDWPQSQTRVNFGQTLLHLYTAVIIRLYAMYYCVFAHSVYLLLFSKIMPKVLFMMWDKTQESC